MACKITWTKQADSDLYKMVEYAEQNWSERSFHNFINKVFASIELLAEFPEMGLIENNQKKLFSFLAVNNVRVFYTKKQDEIVLLAFLDIRSNRKRPS